MTERPVFRIPVCGHGRGMWVTSTLSRVWCRECEGMVEWVRGGWSGLATR